MPSRTSITSNDSERSALTLSADLPQSDPKNDLFGHSPFAKTIATSIQRYASPEGLVLALYGPWGSGKSTVLNYIQHYLEQEKEKPIIVQFNPWWFSGQENLARAFLGQLQAALATGDTQLKQLRRLLWDLADGTSGLIDPSGTAKRAIQETRKKLDPETDAPPKDIPALKTKISNILREKNKRIVVLVDDIDRLRHRTRNCRTVSGRNQNI